MNNRALNSIAASLLALPALGALAAPGALDATFGTGGKTTALLGNCSGYALSVQKDGKIVVGGESFFASKDFTLVRFLADGTVDTTFGSNNDGKVRTDFAGQADQIAQVIAQADGTIIAAGTAFGNAGKDFAVARYLSDGSLDTSFDAIGHDGKVTTDFGAGNDDTATCAVLQADGKIVVAGYASDGTQSDFALVRYNTDGSRDTSFGKAGDSGCVLTDFAGKDDVATGMALQTDGKILVVGYTFVAGGPGFNFALARYKTDGSLDTTFGSGGKVSTDFDNQLLEFGQTVAVLGSGKILVGGARTNDFVLLRYNANGSLDTTFGSGGKVATDFAGTGDTVYSLLVLSSGKILAAGANDKDFTLACYRPNGTLDTSFGTGGKVITDFAGLVDQGRAMTLTSGSRILFAGTSSGTANFALARYSAPYGLPTLKLTGKSKRTTTKARILLRGKTTGNVSKVTCKVGKRILKASGKANWKITAPLKVGRNVLTITAISPDGNTKPNRVTVTRR
jgi:uncharacterized delta-60 repeat protein